MLPGGGRRARVDGSQNNLRYIFSTLSYSFNPVSYMLPGGNFQKLSKRLLFGMLVLQQHRPWEEEKER
jgi:hypothetical protein